MQIVPQYSNTCCGKADDMVIWMLLLTVLLAKFLLFMSEDVFINNFRKLSSINKSEALLEEILKVGSSVATANESDGNGD